jgi:hypothetical protein
VNGFAASKIETGVVQGTANGVADDKSFRQWSVIMRAQCVDGEDLSAGLHQQDRLIADMTEQFAAREIGGCNTLGQIGAAGLLLRHDILPV